MRGLYGLGIVVGCAAAGCGCAANAPQRDQTGMTAHRAGIELLHREQFEKATRELRRAAETEGASASLHNNLGVALLRTGDRRGAVREFDQAIKLDPENPAAWNNLGLVWEDAGEWDRAIDAYNSARSRASADPRILSNLLRARLRRGDQGAEVEAQLRELVSLQPDEPWLSWAVEQLALGTGAARVPDGDVPTQGDGRDRDSADPETVGSHDGG